MEIIPSFSRLTFSITINILLLNYYGRGKGKEKTNGSTKKN